MNIAWSIVSLHCSLGALIALPSMVMNEHINTQNIFASKSRLRQKTMGPKFELTLVQTDHGTFHVPEMLILNTEANKHL